MVYSRVIDKFFVCVCNSSIVNADAVVESIQMCIHRSLNKPRSPQIFLAMLIGNELQHHLKLQHNRNQNKPL